MDSDEVRDKLHDAAGKAVETRDRVADTVKGAVDELNLADLLADFGSSAQDTAASLAESIGEGEAAVREKLEEAEGTIRQHPLLAVGIAAGVGFMLGLLLSNSSGGRDDD
jgi:ElaB/YqjD/DUF883 family membrane-anchored ribosome-binding protein